MGTAELRVVSGWRNTCSELWREHRSYQAGCALTVIISRHGRTVRQGLCACAVRADRPHVRS
eukprot:1714563-Alexandrium_andersonii.AAC.1